MRNPRDISFKLVLAAVFFVGGYVLLQERGGLAGSSFPAYAESIDHMVAPMVQGRLVAVNVALGQKVKAGDVVAKLDDTAIRLARERAVSELGQLKADLDAQLAINKSQVVDTVIRSSSAVADEQAARAEADALKSELERMQKLLAEHLVDAATEQQVRRNYLAAAARVQVFERRRVSLPELYNGKGASADAQTEARVAPYREAIRAKEAAIAQLDFEMTQYEIRAPVDGTVSLLVHPVGDVVGPGIEVLRVVRGRKGHIVATIPEERARGLQPGLELEVRTSRGLWSEKRKGKVVEVGPAVEQLPLRSWLSPSWPRWGRRAVIDVEGDESWNAGDRLYVQF
ncbi:MAG: HlyD family efflux transporter periplasmic adaptor subunit [Myxococcaceae bacterium]